MKIKVERSGGFAGIVTSREIDSTKLGSVLIDEVKSLLEEKTPLGIQDSKPKGAADYYDYKITLQDGERNRVIECNQFNMDDRLKTLIKYVERSSKKES